MQQCNPQFNSDWHKHNKVENTREKKAKGIKRDCAFK